MPRTVTVTVDVEELEKLVWSMRDIATQLSQSQNPRIKAGAKQLQAVPGRVVVACSLREQVGLDGKLHLVAPDQEPEPEKQAEQPEEAIEESVSERADDLTPDFDGANGGERGVPEPDGAIRVIR